MDLKLLKKLIQKNFHEVPVNNSYGKPSSALTISKDYIDGINNCSYEILNDQKIKFYYDGKYIGGLNGQTSLSNKKNGTQIARDKIQTEKYLKANDINTTNSVSFHLNEYTIAEDYIMQHSAPKVIKPYNLSSGKGITLDVVADNFDYAWKKAESEYNDEAENAEILIQDQLPGIEARFLVVEGVYNSAILRVPTNIVGDGNQTVKQLLENKNLQRASNAHLNKFLIKIDDDLTGRLDKLGLNLNSILYEGEVVFLNKVSNIALGGDTYEISHLVSDNLKQLAESAVNAIPDLKSAGVDIMFNSFDDDKASVLEVNHAANLIMHHYPWKGEPKNPIHDLIDTLILEDQKLQKEQKSMKNSKLWKLFSNLNNRNK